MSALRNRDNAKLQGQVSAITQKYYDEIGELQKQMRANSDADKKRILAAAGVKGSKSTDIYDFAVQLANLVLEADKPYGAVYYILIKLQEYAQRSVRPEAMELYNILDNIFNSNLIEKMTVNDPAYKKLEAKYKELTGSKVDDIKSSLLLAYNRLCDLEENCGADGYDVARYFGASSYKLIPEWIHKQIRL